MDHPAAFLKSSDRHCPVSRARFARAHFHGRRQGATAKERAPDLADRVADEKLSLDEAMAILAEHEPRSRQTREAGRIASQSPPEFAGWIVSIDSATEEGEELSTKQEVRRVIDDAYRRFQKLFKEEK